MHGRIKYNPGQVYFTKSLALWNFLLPLVSVEDWPPLKFELDVLTPEIRKSTNPRDRNLPFLGSLAQLKGNRIIKRNDHALSNDYIQTALLR